jgi:hypothetical protein
LPFGNFETGQIARCFYYFFLVVIIMHETKATAFRTLMFIIGIFVNDAIAIAVWTGFSFHVRASKQGGEVSCRDHSKSKSSKGLVL